MWRNKRAKGADVAAVEKARQAAEEADQALEYARDRINEPATELGDQFSSLVRAALQRGWGHGTPSVRS